MHLTAQASRPGFKVVRFAGYTIRVPASWPVYRLDRDPSRCVRYDRHAVYLGQPGANQQCPAHLVGRTATISIQAAGSTPGPASSVADPVGTGAAVGTLPQVGGSVSRDAQDQEMGTSLADPGVSVTGTYTGGGRRVLAILRSLRRGDSHLTHAGAAPGRARVMKGSTAALLSAPLSALPLSATPRGTVTVPRAAATLHASSAARPGHPHTHKGRHHRRAHKHRAHKHRAHKHRAHKHRAHKHRAHKHRAHKHRAHKPERTRPTSTGPTSTAAATTAPINTAPINIAPATTAPATTGGASTGLIRALPASASPGTASTAARLPPWPRCGRGAGRSRPWGSTSAAWRLAVPRRT